MRYTVYEKFNQSVHSDLDIYDPSQIDWSSFKWTNGFYRHYITEHQKLKPYIISEIYYNTPIYEDVILLLNNIVDTWIINSGTLIKVPKLEDIKTFIQENKE